MKKAILLWLLCSMAAIGQNNVTGFGTRTYVRDVKPKQNNAYIVAEADSVGIFTLDATDKTTEPSVDVIVDSYGNRYKRRRLSKVTGTFDATKYYTKTQLDASLAAKANYGTISTNNVPYWDNSTKTLMASSIWRNSNGFIGINKSNPQFQLDINGTVSATAFTVSGNGSFSASGFDAVRGNTTAIGGAIRMLNGSIPRWYIRLQPSISEFDFQINKVATGGSITNTPFTMKYGTNKIFVNTDTLILGAEGYQTALGGQRLQVSGGIITDNATAQTITVNTPSGSTGNSIRFANNGTVNWVIGNPLGGSNLPFTRWSGGSPVDSPLTLTSGGGVAVGSHINFPSQSSAPSSPSSGFSLYADNSNRLAWRGTDTWNRVLDFSSMSADRTITFPASGTVGLLGTAQTWSAANTFSSVVGVGSANTGSARLEIESGATQFPMGILIREATHATSRRATISLGNFQLISDVSGNGTKDFALYNNTSTQVPFFVSNSTGNVGINTASPHASAALDVVSTTGGVGFPAMTTTQRDAISSPRAGLVIFNTTTDKLQVRTSSAWVDLH